MGLAVLFIANLFFGAIHIPAAVVFDSLMGKGDNDALSFIVRGSRLPQAVTALLAGAGLSVSGLLLQTSFRNPLAGPSILGVSSGASLGVALVILLFGGSFSFGTQSWAGYAAIVAGALAGSMMIIAVLMALSAVVRDNTMLLITGILIGYLASSVSTLLSSLSAASEIQSYVIWGMGSFGDVTTRHLPWFSVLTITGLAISVLLSKPLNIFQLGDRYAANLGVNVKRTRNIILFTTGILTAVITAFCGPIAFVGMAMPHISRMIFHTDDHWILIPATMLTGAILCLGCNVASVIPENNIIPVNALTPIVGVPVILYVILNKRR